MKVGDLVVPLDPLKVLEYSTLAMVVEVVPDCHPAKGHPNEAIKIVWCNAPHRKRASLRSMWSVVSASR